MKLGIDSKRIVAIISLITIISILIVPLTVSSENGNEEGFIVVHIGENGHYRSQYFYLYEDDELEIEVEVIKGGNIDVYVMTENQYSNAYTGFEGNEPSAISYLDVSKENISEFEVRYKVPDIDNDDDYYDYDSWRICVVLDNQDSNLTDTDAVPTGLVTARLKLIEHDGGSDIDDFEEPFCLAAMIVIIVLVAIIIIVIFFSLRRSKPKDQFPVPGKPPKYGHYPPYGAYPPYYPYPGEYPPQEGRETDEDKPPKAKPKID